MVRRIGLVAAGAAVFWATWSAPASAATPADDLRGRLERSLDLWARWLSGYLYPIPGTDLYTLNPTLGTGNNPYRDVAGNQFAAAAAGYWLQRANPDEAVARPLRGLIRLALGTHVAVRTVDRPDIQKWGATLSMADDWHADLFAVAQGMLMLGALPPEQEEQLRRILRWEADKQVEYGISKKWRTWPGIWPDHSCGESNAWSATLLQCARLAFPDSDRQAAWRESAMEYSLNAICLPADMTSDKVVGGRPLKDRVKGANFEPGGIQEHHGFYHPGYEGWPLAYQAFAHVMDQQLPEPQRNPDVYLHNWKYVYDRLKQGTFANGRFIHCAGDDWITYGYGNTQFFPAAVFAAAQFQDPDATLLADRWLGMIERQQKITGGCVHGARLAAFQRLRMNDFAWYEGQEGGVLAQALWLLERIDASKIPPAATEAEYNRRNVGTYYEPNARLAWHRDEHGWASVAWRSAFNQWQMVVQPVALPHLLKFNHNGLGIHRISGATPALALEAFRIGTFEDGGFWTIGRSGRESKKVIHGRPDNRVFPLLRQHTALVSLPEGPVVFVDYAQAQDQIWLLRDGSQGLRLAADVFNDHQVKIAANGEEKAWPPHPCQDTWHDLGSRSVTIENRFTIHAAGGEGTFQLMQKRQRDADRDELLYPADPFGADESLLTHELYFGPASYERPRIVSPQEWFRKNVLVMYCDPKQTPAKAAAPIAGEWPCITVALPEIRRIVVVNFAEAEQTAEAPAGTVAVPPMSVKVVAP